MLIPAAQYGDVEDVMKRMKPILRRLLSGESLVDVMAETGLLDTHDHAGMLVLDGSALSRTPNFQCALPWRPLWQKLLDRRTKTDPAINGKIFEASLGTSWGILGLLPYENHPWLLKRERFEPFLDAVLAFWNELDAVGERYYSATQGKRLWDVPNTLHYVLANLGVPKELLRSPLPPGGPRELLKYARAAS